jgi:hypothetical protein
MNNKTKMKKKIKKKIKSNQFSPSGEGRESAFSVLFVTFEWPT